MVPGVGGVAFGALVVISDLKAFLVSADGGMTRHGVGKLCCVSGGGHVRVELVSVSPSWLCKIAAKPHSKPLLAFVHRFKFFGPSVVESTSYEGPKVRGRLDKVLIVAPVLELFFEERDNRPVCVGWDPCAVQVVRPCCKFGTGG